MNAQSAQEEYTRLMEQKQKRGLEDLFFFNRYIIEQNEDRRKLIVPHVHGEWARWYQETHKRIKMILVPRSTFKSTFITCGLSLQKIAKNRDEKILLANATLANSARFLTEIKEHLVKNEEFRTLYGEFYNPKLKWNENEIEVLGRRMGSREATITAAGVGGNLISTHFTTIIADDLVNDENSATRLQANKVIEWWKRAFSLLEPEGEMIVIGTRFTYYELYSYLIDNLSDSVDMFIRSIYKPDGSMYFPERFNEEKVKELRQLHGSWLFSSFYLNEPLDEDSAIIKKSQIQYYEKPPENLAIFACCDPAVSQSAKADFSAIVVVGIDFRNNWYVLETIRGRWQVSELIFQLFDVFERWKPITMTIETIGQAQGLITPIHEEEEIRGKYLPLVVIKTRGEITKNMRVRSILQPRFENKKIYIKEDQFELEDEIIHFPNSKHDDLIECLSDVEEIGFAGEEGKQPVAPEGGYFETQLQPQIKKEVPFDELYSDFF